MGRGNHPCGAGVTGAGFIAWRAHLGISSAEAGRRLGLAPNTITAYEQERSKIPRHVDLACMAIAAALPPWSERAPRA